MSSSYATTLYFQEDHAFDRSIGSVVSNLLVIRNGYDQCHHSGLTPRLRSLARSKHLNNTWLGTGEQLHEKPSKISIALTGLITRLQATTPALIQSPNFYQQPATRTPIYLSPGSYSSHSRVPSVKLSAGPSLFYSDVKGTGAGQISTGVRFAHIISHLTLKTHGICCVHERLK